MVFLTVAGCSSHPEVIVTSESSEDLLNVALAGRGFSNHFEGIKPHSTLKTTVSPRGESGLSLGFDAAGTRSEYDVDIYIEDSGRYRVRITVASNLNVTARYDRSNCFSTHGAKR